MAGDTLDRLFVWHKLPRLLGLLALDGLRHKLRERNLYDTSTTATVERPAPPEDGRHLQNRVRTEEDGKMHVGLGSLTSAGKTEMSPIDEPEFWVGLAMLHTLFAMEHNAICDRLRAEYPSWSDDDLFDHARLINAALLAKIHVTEWSTTILGHPTTKLALRTNR